jgi:hypothetical protein
MASQGYLIIIVPMPGRNALGNYDRFDNVMAAYPGITNWFLGGHSLGGATAIQYVYEGSNPSALAGLITWEAYGAVEFPIDTTSVPVTVIYGHRKQGSVDAGMSYLPASTVTTSLFGANHAQFGYYGEQLGDIPAMITHHNQTEVVVASTMHAMNRVLAGGATEHALYATAQEDLLLNGWCSDAQQTVANTSDVLPSTELPASEISTLIVDHVVDSDEDEIPGPDFTGSSATIDTAATPPIEIVSLLHYGGNATSLNAPPVYKTQVWCKLKSQESIVVEPSWSYTAAGPRGTCVEMNQAAFDWAWNQVSQAERDAYNAFISGGGSLTLMPDGNSQTGPDFVYNDEIVFEEPVPGSGDYELTSAAILVGDGVTGNPDKDNVFYCKVWSPARAVYWILEQK